MEHIFSFVGVLIVLAVFLGVLRFLFPSGALSMPLKLLCGLVAIAVILSPLRGIYTAVSAALPTVSAPKISQSTDYSEVYENQVINIACEGISRECEAYLLKEYGVSAEVNVSFKPDAKDSRLIFCEIILKDRKDLRRINLYDVKARFGFEDVSTKLMGS